MSKKSLRLHEKISLSPDAPLEKRIIELGVALNDNPDYPESILFRKCYSSYLQEHIIPSIKNNTRNVFIGGAKGIGKSVLTILTALILFDERCVVLLEHFDTRLLLVKTTSNEKGIEQVKDILQLENFNYNVDNFPSKEEYVFRIDDHILFNYLKDLPDIVLIQDLGDSPHAHLHVNGPGRKVWVSSPNSDKIKEPLREIRNTNFLYLPRWTLEELQFANERLFLNKLTKEEVEDRFEKFGGIPRSVLPLDTTNLGRTADTLYEDAISTVSLSTLKEVMNSNFDNLPKGNVSGLLVHPIPKENYIHGTRNVFASDQTALRLFQRLIIQQNMEVRQFASVVSDIPAFGQFSGIYLEAHVHRTVPTGPKVTLRKLGKTRKFSTLAATTFPVMTKTVYFGAEDFSDILTFEENVYYQPKSKIFKTLDSFAILQMNLFDKNAAPGTLCLVTFQSTVSPSHGMNGTVLMRLLGVVKEKMGMKLEMFHVFISGKNGIGTAQTIKQEKGQEYVHEPNIQQFVIVLPEEFELLFEKTCPPIIDEE